MSRVRLTVVGDCLLDRDVEGEASRFTPDGPAPVLDEREVRPRPGGAGLAALLASRDGHEVTLVTALADDAGGRELARLLDESGVQVVDLGSRGATPEKIRLRAEGVSLARWDRGGRTTAEDVGGWTEPAQAALDAAEAVLVSCYGRGVAARDDVRAALASVEQPVIWDPHPRGRAPVAGCALVTPNAAEARRTAGVEGEQDDGLDVVTRRAERLLEVCEAGGVVVTLGERGALYTNGRGMPLVVPAPRAATGDPCGAGDRFASAAAVALAAGRSPGEAVRSAVVVSSRFVATGGASGVHVGERAPDVDPSQDAYAVAEQVRARGGTVVATGGCFDLLHAGHVHVLDAARALGDCLIVCLNSDASVRRLKGSQRPIVGEEDRAALLRALTAVDGVLIFDEDTPVPVLEKLRPDVFAKGGDYGDTTIPEAEALASWGGQAVTLPFLEDRSTTDIVEEVRRRGT